MKNKSFIVLLAAVVMAGFASLLIHNWLQARPRLGTIVVAAKSLSFGAELNNDNLTTIEWPSAQLPRGSFVTKANLLKDGSRHVLVPVEPNEPILASKITGAGQRGTLSSLLEGDMRAVTVGVDVVRGVGGFVLPGDRVDVVLIRANGAADEQNYADVVVQNVKVLAVDQQLNERSDKAAIVARAVTLAASSEDSQKILLATNIGKLSLTLRQPGQQNQEPVRRITERDLVVNSPPPRDPAADTALAAMPSIQNPMTTINVMRGVAQNRYEVPRGGP